MLVGSPGMARHVVPMLLDKLSSEVSVSKEASLKALVSGVRAFGPPGVGVHLRAIGQAMFEEVRGRGGGGKNELTHKQANSISPTAILIRESTLPQLVGLKVLKLV